MNMTEEEKRKLYEISKEVFDFTAPEALAWKFNIKVIEYVEDLISEKIDYAIQNWR